MLAGVPLPYWTGFLVFVLAMLALDLGVFHRDAHEVKVKEALVWSGIWVGLALAFNLVLFAFWPQIRPASEYSAGEAAASFLAGYLVEKALSVDNVFVFLVIFAYFQTPAKYQHRVLFWGIIGAVLFRTVFIAAGAAVLERYSWMMIVFGAFLILTGVKMALTHEKKMDPGKNPLLRAFRRIVPSTDEYHGQAFWIRKGGKLLATPLFLTLLVVEFTDVVFAVDSIPAIFAITREPFIVLTSNVFAILGLRALFFAIAGLVQAFHYLSYGLAAILVFVGGKQVYAFYEKAVVPELPKFPVGVSLAVIAGILAASVLASVWFPKRPGPEPEPLSKPS
jgi:tellurite resistance protein TerC